jgi:UDP-2,3-diacylglucosamine pyrophosphatase LpxH
MTTVVASDLHLGSRNCQAALFAKFLQTDFDRLILNGDILNSLNLKKLKAEHWTVLSRLRDIARRRELILIRGNHDGSPAAGNDLGQADVLPTLLGVPLHHEYQLEMGDRHYLIIHGDRFDPTLHAPIITDAADWCYHAVQKVNKKMAKWLKRRVKKLGGVLEFVKRRSVHYAKSLGCQGVITAHTHFSDDEWIEDVHYLNSGCWVDRPCTYLIAENDRFTLRHWDEDEPMVRERKRFALPEVARRHGQVGTPLVEIAQQA